jgi:SNF2 family DNA or RNA helicase
MTVTLPASDWQWHRMEAAWAPPPQPPREIGALHGELTPDGRIVLMTAGCAVDQNRIATLAGQITATPAGTGLGAITIPCTWGNVVQLGWTFSAIRDLAWVPGERLQAWMAAEAARRYAPLPELEPSWPPWLVPRDYQIEGARMIARARRFFLLDDMGLGKTITTLIALEQIRRMGHAIFPLVILVPSWDVADGWYREIVKWSPAEHWHEPQMYAGTSRTRLLRHPGVNVLISTYATARLDAADAKGPLVRYQAASVVIDEASLIQNAKAKLTTATERIAKNAGNVIELSGTLITRDAGGSFAPLKAADPGTWGSKERYRDRFLLTRKDDYSLVVTGLNPHAEQQFRACLASQMVRRAKADVLPELPDKTYSVLRPEIPPEWMQAYRDMEDHMLAELPDGGELSAFDTLTKFTRLSQLASSAADVRWEDVLDEETGLMTKKAVVTLRYPSWKAESLMGVLRAATGPVAVFAVSKQLARITGEDYLKPAGLRYGYVTGQGQGVTRGTRRSDIEAFQDGKLDAIICTAGAGGVGITLTAADTVVLLQRALPLDKAVQPEDRVHRMGNLAPRISIIDIVAKGTVDQRVRNLLHGKAGQLAEFARDPRIVRELLGGNR